MVYIKKMVMQGFKSFARRTEITFDKGINIVLGPNGSGKSNISDALCFVLGRLSIKSMRAVKSKNLIFMGSKYVKPSKEAVVELIFDNSDRAFSIENDEIHLKRIVRFNGQGIYKINGETKTRAEVIETLAQAGIDPYGFNIILQGQIQAIVKMHPEERRKIIEEVAGIAIYESRKEKSLRELEKTDERLKEISTILRERTALLRNLEKERAQAQKFKEYELSVKRCKASVIHKKTEEKNREINSLKKSIQEKTEQKEKIKEKAEKLRKNAEELSEKINEINMHIQQATGIEQETLHNGIANLKAELEGLKVRKENFENRKNEIEKRISEMSKAIPELEDEMHNLKKKSPTMAKKAEELKKKKQELQEIGEERRKLLTIRVEINSLKERSRDKERQTARIDMESEHILRQIEEYESKLKYKDENECNQAVHSVKNSIASKKEEFEALLKKEMENIKLISVCDSEISRLHKIREDVGKIDICPLCQSKITASHVEHVIKDAEGRIKDSQDKKDKTEHELKKINENKETARKEIKNFEESFSFAEIELLKLKTISEKKEALKKLLNDEKSLKNEIFSIEEKKKNFESKTFDLSKIEESYEAKILEIEEISSRTEEDVDTTLLYKEREIENMQNIIKRSKKDFEDIANSINDISNNMESKSQSLNKKELQEKELNEKFKRMFEERNEIQKNIQNKNLNLSEIQSEIRQIEDQVNYLKIGMAKVDAEKEALDMEMSEYAGVELYQASLNVVEEKLKKAQEALQEIGSINMRALEVYDDVKKEYDLVQEKVNILEKEKLEILKIIEEIDKKKTKTFMKTFRAMNEIFTENFSKLYSKGIAFLELENKEDIFSGGVNIVVKLAKGKYFDVTSLSGGEQTLVALSLLFAIQEYKPYHFYVFDEIDAALDKRNSERLAGLLNRYIQTGQYLIITHNDAIIMNANILYGVSMHESVSKILSLKVGDDIKNKEEKERIDRAIKEEAETELKKTEDEVINEDEWEAPEDELLDAKTAKESPELKTEEEI